jgi:hypothetical protein
MGGVWAVERKTRSSSHRPVCVGGSVWWRGVLCARAPRAGGGQREIYKVVWTDPSLAGRGPAAVVEARRRLGEVSGYNPVPRFGMPSDGLNCESFVRQCLDGHARSAQAELVTGDPNSDLCPVM